MNKIVENELMFARTNAKMAKATSGLAPADFPQDFVLELYCECANKLCMERISIAYDAYKGAKADIGTFVVRPKHYLPEFEQLIKKEDYYWIIVKRPEKLDKPFEL